MRPNIHELSRLELASLSLVVAVAETGSFGGAAAAAGISQPAVSARSSALERRLGVQVFERSPRGSVLTAEGGLVLDWCRNVLSAAEQLLAGSQALAQARGGPLRVGSSLTIAEHLLAGWLATLAEEGEPLEVRLEAASSAVVAEGVLQGRSEIGFVEGTRLPAGLSGQVLARDRLVVVVGPTHPWARRRRPLRPAELAQAPLIAREEGSGTKETLVQALRRAGAKMGSQARAEVANLAALRALLRSGQGASALSELAVAEDLRSGRLVEVPTEGVDLSRSLRVVWRSGASLSPEASRLLRVAKRWGRGQRS